MNSSDELLSFMDLLDLDEEVIDSRLETIMVRNSYSNNHLKNALQLLHYKLLINKRECIECENDTECNFVAKLINHMNEGNLDYICKITNIVLSLDTGKIVSKSEHLIQQILSNVDTPLEQKVSSEDIDEIYSTSMIHNFKLCDSILDAVISNGQKLSLPFLETPLENILSTKNERLKINFLSNTVPRLFEGVIGYNILDRIWNYLKQSNRDQEHALIVLSCLAEFYLPVADNGIIKFNSQIMSQYEFWNILLFGLISNDPSVRKISVYLIKRTIDCFITLKRDVSVKCESRVIFEWTHKKEKALKQMWDNFFILIDSLEEKQSNIVLPSLKLFETLKDIQKCWLNCAFNIGLLHDNTQVRLRCIDYRLKTRLLSEAEATLLLEALNDINLYENSTEYEHLNRQLLETLKDTHTLVHILKAMAGVKWSPVPFYHITNVLAGLHQEKKLSAIAGLPEAIINIFKVPCNKIVIRKAVHMNISYFIGNCCKNMHWRDFVLIYSSLRFGFSSDHRDKNPFQSLIENLNLYGDEKEQFFNLITDSHTNIDVGLLYLEQHPNDVTVFSCKVSQKISKVKDIVNRQYSNKSECYNDVVFLTHLLRKTSEKDQELYITTNSIITREFKTLIQYILCLLSSEAVLDFEEITLLFKEFNITIVEHDLAVKEIIIELYKSSVLLLQDLNTDISKRVISIFLLNILMNGNMLEKSYKHQRLTLKQFLEMICNTDFKNIQNVDNIGRLKNVFYEKSCQIVYAIFKEQETNIQKDMKDVIQFLENMMECGGYGCLKWILKIKNKVLPELLNNENINFDIIQFINRMWKEIEELKSNNQYSPCIEEFVTLITQDSLLKTAMYNNIVILYCNKIIEYGSVKNSPLFFLIKKLAEKGITADMGQIIYVLSEILLYSPTPRKDQRIVENLEVAILCDAKYGIFNKEVDLHFNFQIQYLSILTLSKITSINIYETIILFIINKIHETFKNKQRYHGNSQPHKLLLTGMQHLLFIALLDINIVSEKLVLWCVDLLGKLPHQPSVRICLEWYIALFYYIKKADLNAGILDLLKSSNISISSQFMILYWTLKHKLNVGTYKTVEFDFVMDFLLSHTMGQMFNVRLHAQYLATNLYASNQNKSDKYTYIIEVIRNTFEENAKDKHFVKLKDDFLVNDFNLVHHLTPAFIYYFLPRYCDIGINENVDKNYISSALKDINANIDGRCLDSDFKQEWIALHKRDDDVYKYNLNTSVESIPAQENDEKIETIQKKYIPWKNMSDVDVYKAGKKRESSSELIVVASLIDKLPNLGGMARTSEVFGVKTYVVDSLRHLQDKQFQGLSVSAERWIHIEEVRPGQNLKNYLICKKTEGYSVIAAEQTSTSSKLQSFKFPKKTLLLLGHEKEGIPCDLLPLMDHCVEIPQQGFVRSLNVHVTAAIFVWEYARQNLL